MFKWITSLFSSTKLLIGSGLVILSLLGASYGLYNAKVKAEYQLGILRAEKASYEAALISSTNVIIDLNNRIIKSKQESVDYQNESLNIKKQYNSLQEKFDSHKGRDEAIINNPKLMNKFINKSFNELIDKVSCNSGDLDKCKK